MLTCWKYAILSQNPSSFVQEHNFKHNFMKVQDLSSDNNFREIQINV